MAHHLPHPDLPDPLPVASVGDGRSIDRAPLDDEHDVQADHHHPLSVDNYLESLIKHVDRACEYIVAAYNDAFDAHHYRQGNDDDLSTASLHNLRNLRSDLEHAIDNCRSALHLLDSRTIVDGYAVLDAAGPQPD